ncbi:MAG: hypothetical protein QOF73_2637 [Thermomicrobiales bacterium]|nr:hypothetical protein [Thermomicrobiales bacterium]
MGAEAITLTTRVHLTDTAPRNQSHAPTVEFPPMARILWCVGTAVKPTL